MDRARVLDVGQCDFDHQNIRNLLEAHFDVEVQRAHSVEEAQAAASTGGFQLILVNRLMDRDGAEGLDLVRHLSKSDLATKPPIMLVSNLPEAQSAAVAAGAAAGFGKAGLGQPETRERLAEFLPTKPGSSV